MVKTSPFLCIYAKGELWEAQSPSELLNSMHSNHLCCCHSRTFFLLCVSYSHSGCGQVQSYTLGLAFKRFAVLFPFGQLRAGEDVWVKTIINETSIRLLGLGPLPVKTLSCRQWLEEAECSFRSINESWSWPGWVAKVSRFVKRFCF